MYDSIIHDVDVVPVHFPHVFSLSYKTEHTYLPVQKHDLICKKKKLKK